MAGHDADVTDSATDSLGSSPLVPASEETFELFFFFLQVPVTAL